MRSLWHRGKDSICPWWIIHTFDNPLRRLLHNPRKILSPYVKSGMTALDVGCGKGYFTIEMARLVGTGGQVLAVDMQEQMLAGLGKRAQRAGVADTITPVKCTAHSLGITEPIDFALAFWMAHETPDAFEFFTGLHSMIKPGGSLLLAEPLIHVSGSKFEAITEAAVSAGFKAVPSPAIKSKIAFSRTQFFSI